MNVNSTGSTQQMQQMQGSGQGGMKEIMQNLSQEDRVELKDKMSSLSQEDKQSMKLQMQEIDATSMTSAEYTQTLFDMLETQPKQTTTSNVLGFSIYA